MTTRNKPPPPRWSTTSPPLETDARAQHCGAHPDRILYPGELCMLCVNQQIACETDIDEMLEDPGLQRLLAEALGRRQS